MAQSVYLPAGATSNNGVPPQPPARVQHLVIVGASRGTGKLVLEQALAAGHTVTVVARDPARIALRHERLRVLRGDVLDPASLVPAIAGQDAVVSTIGVTTGRAPTTLFSEGLRNIIQAMRNAHVKRLLAQSAGPLSIDDGDTALMRLALKPLLWAIFKQQYADLARMEQEIRDSGLDWTIMRPPKLSDKPPTGQYRTALNLSVRGGFSIARADLAAAILTLLDDPAALRAAVGIAY